MGGSVGLRRAGLITRLSSTISDGMLPASDPGLVTTGCFSEAAVEGLRSCLGDGCLLMVEDWMVSAICSAGSVIVKDVAV